MSFIEKSNDFVLLFSFVFIVVLAESFATIGVFLIAKGFIILGIIFYVLKIIIYIPSIDIFKRNKERLLKYKIIQIGAFLYEKIENNPLFLEFKRKIKEFKEMILISFRNRKFKKDFIEVWRNLWKV